MGLDTLEQSLYEGLLGIPLIDAHTHLVGGQMCARGLHDILLYHMAVSDLYAAGCPSGRRLTEFPGSPSREEAHQRIVEALPFLPRVRNTSTSWGVRMILSDLFDWQIPLTEANWPLLDSTIRERSGDPAWDRQVMQRAGIQRFVTEYVRRGTGQDDALLQYSLEWGFFTRTQWGEYDTALYELERCWGRQPEPPTPIGAGRRPPTDRTIHSVEDVLAAVEHYVSALPADSILSVATHISTDLDLEPVTEEQMARALARRGMAGPEERNVYASFVNEGFLRALERHYGNRIVVQFSFGAEPLPFETGSRLSQRAIRQLAEMVSRHPGLHFQCFLASRHANQSLCTLCRELPNLSVAGYWWHNFFPSVIRQVIEERLDMLPLNRQVGFFSDAYCVEWAYAKASIVRRQLAAVLAKQVAQGQYTFDDALTIAQEVLFMAPQQLLGVVPASGTA